MNRVILDVDTGIDDALAILYAIKSTNLKLEGITTGYGNTDVEQVTDNTLRIVNLANPRYDFPVVMGAKKPLFRPGRKHSSGIHGNNGIGDYQLPPTTKPISNENAADFIIRKINEYPNEMTLVMTGRLTNLAIAVAKEPSIAKKIKRLVLMGGALKVPGNITPVSEANIHGDPEAAHRVFESDIPITMVGLDVTSKVKFGEYHLEKLLNGLSNGKNDMKAFINHIFTFSFDASERINEGRFRLLHDPLAVGVVEDASFVNTEDYYIYIETKSKLSLGATLADLRTEQKKVNASVCMEVRSERFIDHFINTIIS